jgi:4-hydroxybenzoate polyprenyltransferase
MGTIAIGFFALKLLNVIPNPVWWVVLPMAVWVIYSTDHILDSFKKKNESVILRHKYYFENKITLITITILLGITAIILSLLYPELLIFKAGAILSMIIVLYFITINIFDKKINIPKEFVIAFVYTSGIFMAPIIWFGTLPSFTVLFIMCCIFLLAWAEGIMISWFDFDNDIKDGHNSFTVMFGKQKTRYFLLLLHITIELAILTLLFLAFNLTLLYILLIILIMNLLLALVIMFPNSFLSTNYHRFIGEGVFLLPALIVFV